MECCNAEGLVAWFSVCCCKHSATRRSSLLVNYVEPEKHKVMHNRHASLASRTSRSVTVRCAWRERRGKREGRWIEREQELVGGRRMFERKAEGEILKRKLRGGETKKHT